MVDLSADLDRLDNLLSSLPLDAEAMPLSELDGFLAGLLILPEPADEAEWLPHIWNHCPLEGDELAAADEIAGLARLRKTEIAYRFRQGDYSFEPVFDIDTDGSFLWEVWLEGYERAAGLQENIYDTLIDGGDESVRKAITGLVWVSLAARGELEGFGGKTSRAELHELVPQMLPRLVENLFRGSHGLPVQGADPQLAQVQSRAEKVGRNEPCPCGSGKKYKKCCGG